MRPYTRMGEAEKGLEGRVKGSKKSITNQSNLSTDMDDVPDLSGKSEKPSTSSRQMKA